MKGVRWHYILILGLSMLLAISILVLWPEPSAPETLPTPTELLIPWDEAGDHIGYSRVVEGRVAAAEFDHISMGKPTLLYLGNPPPDPDRFGVLIWSDQRGRFVEKFPPDPETYLLNRIVRVRGVIDNDRGYPSITLSDPAGIWIVE